MAYDLTGPVLQEVLACAQANLSPSPSKAFVYAGLTVPWDQCGGDTCGQVWVRLVSMTPITTAGVQPCGVTAWIATVGVGVIRCVAGMDDQGTFPSGAEMTVDGLVMTQDMSDLMQAITCCGQKPRSMDRWTPLGAAGGCAGGEWTVTYRIGTCGCPDPEV